MRGLGLLAVLLLAGGAGTLAYAASRGEASAGVVVVFPFVVGTGSWGFLGGLLLMAGVLLAFMAFARRGAPPDPELAPGDLGPPQAPAARKAAGFILVGPIPIAFGTTRGLALALLLLGLAALALLLLLPRLLGGP